MISSGSGTAGVIEIEVALLVAQVRVVVCPELTEVGLAVNDEMTGGAMGATCTFVVCGALVPPGPVAVAE